MADDAPAEDPPITFHVKSSSDARYTLTLSPSITVSDLKNKLATAEYADVPADRQRLIYSGRVLKDGDTLNSYKIKEGNTIHMVKGAASNQRQNPASQSTSSPAGASTPGQNQGIPGVPSNFAAGTGNNPLAGLTGARYAGFAQLPGAGMFGPDGGMGPPPDTEQMINMLQNPQFQSTMNEALQNPQLIDMMIQQNPMLRDMGPGVRQMMQSPEFRRMLTDPETLRSMSQMQRAMGMNPFGPQGAAGNSAFPAPGVTATTPADSQQGATDSATPNQTDTTGTPQTGTPVPPVNPFAAMGNPSGEAGANPFAALFGSNPFINAGSPSTPGGNSTATGGQPPINPILSMLGQMGQAPSPMSGTPSDTTSREGQSEQQQQAPPQAAANPFANLQNNPFLQNPALLSQMMQGLGGGAGGQNPNGMNDMFASMFPHLAGGAAGAGSGTPPPTDSRPPEERYAEQLRQLNDMGFYDFDRNIEALRRSGGSVQGAVEYLLSH